VGNLLQNRQHLTFEELDSYIREMDEAVNLNEIFAILQKQIQKFGFEKLTYWVRWPSFETKHPIFITTYPRCFIDHYLEVGYQSYDMVGRFSTEKNTPFVWTDIEKELPITRMQRALFDDSSSAGLKSGGSIPIHGPNLIKATFSVANDAPEKEFDALFQYRRHELHLLATYAHEKIMVLGLDTPLKNVQLTPRQAEILTWVARGKTYWETGEILSIQEDTVKKIMKDVLNRLSASNSTHAASKAIIHGLIIP
jgi:LuxR family transcriptional regulator, activator of conjugal transfer of Ti plasmids